MDETVRHSLKAETVLESAVQGIDFDTFFERNLERARRLAWRLVGGDDAAAADIVQEAFFKAYRGLEAFRADAKLDTWFYRIVVNEAASYRRRGWFRRRFGGASDSEKDRAFSPIEGEGVGPHTADPGMRRRIAAALARLSRGQREAFVLVHLESYTVREAAELMGVGEGSVKRHLHRALVRLRRELADLEQE